MTRKEAEELKIKARILALKEKELQAADSLEQHKEENKIEFVSFLPHQQRVIDLIQAGKKTILMVCGNRAGKCLTFDTLVETVNGEISIGELYKRGEPFYVWAWDGEKRVPALASAPFNKPGLHECYRITMSDGRIIEAADHHKILMNDGNYTSVYDLLPYFSVPLESSQGLSRIAHASDDQNSFEIASDCQDHYLKDSRQYDEQLRHDQGNDRVFPPSQVCEMPFVSFSNNSDVQGNTHRGILLRNRSHPSIQYVQDHFSAQSSGSLSNTSCRHAQQCLDANQGFQPLSIAGASGSLSCLAVEEPCVSLLEQACFSPLEVCGNSIVSIIPIGVNKVYDFEVEKYHNYFAGGLIHHNTTLDAILIGLICIPRLRDIVGMQWLDGLFPRKNCRIRILCKDWEHHAGEVIVPVLKEWLPKEYETKKNNVGIDAFWKFKNGSTLELVTNKQATEDLEGWKGHLVIQDETTTRDKYIALKRGLVDYSGVYLMTFTAVDTSWVLDDIVLREAQDPSIGCIVGISSYENTFLKKEDIENFERSLTDTEKTARINGNFINLEGRVWKNFSPSKHVCEPFKVPPDWPVEFQIDFHLSTKQAVAFTACDPYGRYFVVDEIWENTDTGIGEIADEIIRRKQSNGWRMRYGEIDALSKGDTKYTRNILGTGESSFDILRKKLMKYGITLGVGSKDEKSYVKAVEARFKGPNGEPTMKVFNSCVETIRQIQRWTYDDNGKPKDDGHFPECIGRQTQTGLHYTDPREFTKELNLVECPV